MRKELIHWGAPALVSACTCAQVPVRTRTPADRSFVSKRLEESQPVREVPKSLGLLLHES